jgi:hypothetical protein
MIGAIKVVVKTQKLVVNPAPVQRIIVRASGTQGPPGNVAAYDPGDLAGLFNSI